MNKLILFRYLRYILTVLISIVFYSCGDGFFDDKNNNLMWQDEPYTLQERRAYSNNTNYEKVGSWPHALSYCNNLSLNNYHDWHLPTRSQLQYLYNNKGELVNVLPEYYWSFITDSPGIIIAWYVRFSDGYTSSIYRSKSSYVRCVRDR